MRIQKPHLVTSKESRWREKQIHKRINQCFFKIFPNETDIIMPGQAFIASKLNNLRNIGLEL